MRRTQTIVKGRKLGGSSLVACAEWTATLGRAVSGLAALAIGGSAFASPQGEQVVQGAVRFERRGAETLIYAGRNSIINYRSFDVARNETVRFVQPDASSRVLNRINSAAPTRIDGSLFANGIVYFVNPSGVYFGQGSVINVGGIYAGAAQITNSDFLRNVDRFTNARGSVVNNGTIVADYAALVGGHVENNGSIIVPQGTVVMAAGRDLLLSNRGSNVSVKITGPAAPTGDAAVVNTGSIQGKKVSMAAGDALGMAILNAGTVRAQSARLEGHSGGEVAVTGTVDVSSDTGRGGDAQILGQYVGIRGGTIDASGATGGGTILVGGGREGGGGVRASQGTYVSDGATIRADATTNGHGGEVIVYSDNVTRIAGDISARGAGDGAGGFVETSGKGELTVAKTPDVTAESGNAGTWLIDPRNVTIVAGGGNTNINTANPFAPTGDDAQLGVDLIEAALNGGASVVVNTGSSGTQQGNITLSTNLDFNGTGNATLTLSAANDITINGTISDGTPGGDSLNLILTADADSSGGGNIGITQAINLGTGNFTATGVDFANSGSGLITGATLNLAMTGAVALDADITASTSMNLRAGTDGTGNLSFASAGVILASPSISLQAGNGAGGAGAAGVNFANAPSIRGTGGAGTSPTSFAVRQDAPITDAGVLNASAFGGGVTGMTYGLRSDDNSTTISTGSKFAGSNLALFGTSVTIGGDIAPASLTVDGATNLNGNVATAGAGPIVFNNAVNVGANDRILSGGNIVLTAGASSSGGGLTVTNTGTLTVGAAINLTGAGAFTQNGSGGVTLNAAISTANQNITFAGATTIGGSFEINAGTGTIDFNNALALGSNTLTLTGDEIDLAGANSVTGTNATLVLQPLGPATSIGIGGGSGTLDVSASDLAALTDNFGSLIVGRNGGTHAVAIASSSFRDPLTVRGGAITTSGDLTGTGNASITLAGTGATLGGNIITANQAISIAGDTALGASTRTLSGSTIALGGNVSSTGGGLTIVNTGLFTLGGDANLTGTGGFTQTGAGALQINGDIITQNRDIVFGGGAGAITFGAGGLALDAGTANIVIGRAATFNAGTFNFNASEIDFTGGANSLTGVSGSFLSLTPGQDAISIGVNGGAGTLDLSSTDLAALADGFGRIVIGSAVHTGLVTMNAGTWRDPITVQVQGAGGGIVVNGAQSGTGNASIALLGATPTQLNADITTSGQAINISGGLLLGSGSNLYTLDTTVGFPDGANITVSGATNAQTPGAPELRLRAGVGDVSFGAIGDTGRLLALRLVNADDATFGATNADFVLQNAGTGTSTFASILANDAVNLNGNAFSFGAVTVNGGFGFQLVNAGTATLAGNINSQGPVSIGGAANWGSLITTSGDDVTFNGNITLTGASGVISNNGNVSFERTINGAQTLGITSGNGQVIFNGIVGGTTAPTSVTVFASGRTDVNEAMRAGSITLISAGDLRFSDNLTATTGAINLQAASDGSGIFTFFNPNTSFNAGEINLRAGDGAGGLETAFIDLGANAPTFRGAAGGNTSPTTFSFRQDAAIADANILPLARFGNGVSGMTYVYRSDAGTITIANSATAPLLNGSNLSLVADSSTIGTYLVLSGFGAFGDLSLATDLAVNNNSDILVDGVLTLTGNATTLFAGGGRIFLNGGVAADDATFSLIANDVTIGATITGTGDLVIQPGVDARPIIVGGSQAGALSLDATELGFLANGWRSITIGSATGTGGITTGAPLTFSDPVTLRSPNGGVTTIAHELRGTGNGGVTIDGFGTLTLTNNIITEGGAIAILDAVRLGSNVILDSTNSGVNIDGADVSVAGLIDADDEANNRTLTVNAGSLGTARLDGRIGSTEALQSVDVTGALNILGGATTLANQRYTGNVVLRGDLRSTTAGEIRIVGNTFIADDVQIQTAGQVAGDRIVLLGGVDSIAADQNHTLTLSAGLARIDITGSSGFAAALNGFNATAAEIATASVRTLGAVNYNGGTTLLGNVSGTDVLFNGTFLLGGDSQVSGTGSVRFAGFARSEASEFNDLTVISPVTTFAAGVGDAPDSQLGRLATSGGTVLQGGVVRTTEQQSYGGDLVLEADTLLSSGNGGVSVSGALDSRVGGANRNLTINTTGETFFGSAVGAAGNLSTLIITGGGTTRIAGSQVRSANSQTYAGALTLDSDVSFFADGILFAGPIDSASTGAHSLTATGGAGGVNFAGDVGQTNALSVVTATAGLIALHDIRTTGGQTYTGTINLSGDLASTGSGTIALLGSTKLLANSSVTTAGAAGDDVRFAGPIDGLQNSRSLLVTAGQGNATFTGDVGQGTGTDDRSLSDFTVQAAAIDVRGVRTTGSQVLSGATSLRGNLTSTSVGGIAIDGPATLLSDIIVTTNNGGITFGGAIDSDSTARALSVVTGGSSVKRFAGAIGNNSRLSTLTTNNDGRAQFEGGNIRTNGLQRYDCAVTLAESATFESPNITFGSTVDSSGSPRNLIVNTAAGGSDGVVTFTGNVGATAPMQRIQTAGTGRTRIGANMTSTQGMDFSSTIALLGASTIDAGTGALIFRSTINTETGLAPTALTLRSTGVAGPDGSPFRFGGSIGNANALASLTIGQDLASVPTAATIVFSDGFDTQGRVLASSFAASDTFTINTSGNFTMGRGHKLTTFGRLRMNVGGTATLGDLVSLADIQITATAIQLQLRPVGTVTDNFFESPNDVTLTDTGLDIVAAGQINFSVAPTVIGSGGTPVFANNSATGSATLAAFPFRRFDGGVKASLFADTRSGGANFLLPLDLRATGASTAQLATSIAGVLPRDVTVGVTEITSPISASQEASLSEMGIRARDLTVEETIGLLAGRSLFDDLKPRSGLAPEQYSVASSRLSSRAVDRAVTSYRDLVSAPQLDASGNVVLDENGKELRVDRTAQIKQTVAAAWASYASKVEAPTGLGFRAYLETRGAEASREEVQALELLDASRDVLENIRGIGLSEFETSIPRRKLLNSIRPEGVPAREFQEAVTGQAEELPVISL